MIRQITTTPHGKPQRIYHHLSCQVETLTSCMAPMPISSTLSLKHPTQGSARKSKQNIRLFSSTSSIPTSKHLDLGLHRPLFFQQTRNGLRFSPFSTIRPLSSSIDNVENFAQEESNTEYKIDTEADETNTIVTASSSPSPSSAIPDVVLNSSDTGKAHLSPVSKSKLKKEKKSKHRKKRSRGKAKRIRRLIKAGEESSVPLQTQEDAEFLFDSLAPHLEMNTLESLIDIMNHFSEPGKYTQLVSSLSMEKPEATDSESLEENEKDDMNVNTNTDTDNSSSNFNHTPKDRIRAFLSTTKELEEIPWVKPLLSRFLMGKTLYQTEQQVKGQGQLYDDMSVHTYPYSQSLSSEDTEFSNDALISSIWDDMTFTPNRNRLHLDTNIQVLMKAREKAANTPLKWGITKKKQNEHQRKETLFRHNMKPEALKRKEAEEIALLIADRLPQHSHERLLDMLHSYGNEDKDSVRIQSNVIDHSDSDTDDSSSISTVNMDKLDSDSGSMAKDKSKKKKKPRKRSLKNIFPRIKQKVNFHVPHVINELGAFLYVDVPNFSDPRQIDADFDLPPHHSQFNEHRPQKQKTAEAKQLERAWKKWYQIREKQAKLLLLAQHQFAFFDETEEKNEAEKLSLEDEMESHVSGKMTTTPTEKRRRGTHVDFDAIQLDYGKEKEVGSSIVENQYENEDEDSASTTETSSSTILQENMDPKRVVFLKNLPIDVTSEEIRENYERCGPISSLRIFNQRPDLDPGRRTLQELKALVKKQRLNMKEVAKCTPVYALVEFATEEGYDIATNIHLKIFGMVIRRHTVKSVPADKVRNVYIENIPSGFYSLDLEYKLNKALQPYVYVCLDRMNGKKGRGRDHAYLETSSCKIKFPNFEAAIIAYEKLQMIDIIQQTGDDMKYEVKNTVESVEVDSEDETIDKNCLCTLQWMKTPGNAMQYWKREINP